MKQPKSSQNLVIFDWDDTLFPTTYLNPVDDTQYEMLREKFATALEIIENEAIKLVQACLQNALVVVITNAKKGWVEFSSSFFMPKLHALMMKGYLRVLSARVDYEEMYPFDTYKWKEMAFQKLWREQNFLDRAAILNLIAIGDSDYEMEAAKLFASQSDRCLVKLVKMRENPTFEELHKELAIINDRYPYIFSQFKNLTIKLER